MPRFPQITAERGFFSSQGPYAEILYWVARLWRFALLRTRIVALTGSVGKTTAKEATAAVLAKRYRTRKNSLTVNSGRGLWRTILRIKPWVPYAVLEIGAGAPGMVRKAADAVRPQIAVVLAVRMVHYSAYRRIENIAEEKSSLLSSLRPGGVAVLNADDPLVAQMAAPAGCRTVYFGAAEGADVRLSAVESRWPDRLAFHLSCAGETVRVQTRLVGEHWAPSLAAAAAVGWLCGVPLEEVREALEALEPSPARCQPVMLPNGAVVVRDEYNGSLTSYEVAMRWLSQARAGRRITVWGDYSDTSEKPRKRMRALGEAAARCADVAVFVGERSEFARQAAAQAGLGGRALAFVSLQEAAAYLRDQLREGDLVLLKGRTTEHLSRLVLSQFGAIGCWRQSCRKRTLCEFCDELGLREDLRPGTAESRIALRHSGRGEMTASR